MPAAIRLAILAFLLFLAAIVNARAADDYLDCSRAGFDDAQTENGIVICGRLIRSGKWRGHDLARLHSNRAALYIKVKRLDAAMADLDKAVSLWPDYPFLYDNRGEIFRLRGDYMKAIGEYNHAIRVDPKFLSAYFDRGLTFEMMGNIPSARSDYQLTISTPGISDRPLDKWAKDQARKALQRLDTEKEK
jgi:tetratricopeptide (TPR) repeat protein